MAGKYEGRSIGWLRDRTKNKPPLWPAVANGERGATPNHVLQALAVGYVAGEPGYRDKLLDYFARQEREGHMLNEALTPSHWHHWTAPVAAVANGADFQVRATALGWLARELALCLRFWEPAVRRGSVVAPGARGWGGWKAGSVPSDEQHSPMRDAWVRWMLGETKTIVGAYTPGLDVEARDLLLMLPREEILAAAEKVNVTNVRLVAPIYEATQGGVKLRYWYPPISVTRTRPTVYVASVGPNGDDCYSCLPGSQPREELGPARVGVAA